MYACIHAYVHTCIHAYTHTCIHACTKISCTHTRAYTHTHTHRHVTTKSSFHTHISCTHIHTHTKNIYIHIYIYTHTQNKQALDYQIHHLTRTLPAPQHTNTSTRPQICCCNTKHVTATRKRKLAHTCATKTRRFTSHGSRTAS
jgi:hypothetical protein